MSYRASSSQNQAAHLLEGWRCTPAEVANDAIAWFDTLSQADADSAIDRPIDRIIKILRNDERMPRLTAVVTLVTSASRPPNRTAIGKIIKLEYAGAVHLDAGADRLSPSSSSFPRNAASTGTALRPQVARFIKTNREVEYYEQTNVSAAKRWRWSTATSAPRHVAEVERGRRLFRSRWRATSGRPLPALGHGERLPALESPNPR